MKNLPENLTYILKRLPLCQDNLAKRVGSSQPAISKMASGITANSSLAIDVAQALGITAELLKFGNIDEIKTVYFYAAETHQEKLAADKIKQALSSQGRVSEISEKPQKYDTSSNKDSHSLFWFKLAKKHVLTERDITFPKGFHLLLDANIKGKNGVFLVAIYNAKEGASLIEINLDSNHPPYDSKSKNTVVGIVLESNFDSTLT